MEIVWYTVDCKSLVSKTLYQILSLGNQFLDDIIYSLPDWLNVTSGKVLTDKELAIHCTFHLMNEE